MHDAQAESLVDEDPVRKLPLVIPVRPGISTAGAHEGRLVVDAAHLEKGQLVTLESLIFDILRALVQLHGGLPVHILQSFPWGVVWIARVLVEGPATTHPHGASRPWSSEAEHADFLATFIDVLALPDHLLEIFPCGQCPVPVYPDAGGEEGPKDLPMPAHQHHEHIVQQLGHPRSQLILQLHPQQGPSERLPDQPTSPLDGLMRGVALARLEQQLVELQPVATVHSLLSVEDPLVVEA
mmetsp:Transcript_16319/g.34458  ORF Transcript_16319/g.34458 Transcript_16319/m.34458 type:complete len:239 (-) Transcript_16319:140-856(-)